MRHGNNTLPTSSSCDDLVPNNNNFLLFNCPSTSSSPNTTSPSPNLLSPSFSSSAPSTHPLHVDLLSTQLLPSPSASESRSPHSGWSSASSSTASYPLLTCNVDEAVLQADSQRTPCLGWRLDTRPAVDEPIVVTVNSMPVQQQQQQHVDSAAAGSTVQVGAKGALAASLSIDTDEADDSVNALLSSLLSAGLSASRRFSYPPTTHTLASLPNQPHLTHSATSTSSTASAASSSSFSSSAGGPLRSVSPALMSPSAASNFFQTLDRKRAFKPYYRTPTFTATSVHRVHLTLSLRHPSVSSRRHSQPACYTAAVYAVDPSNASVVLVGYERLWDGLGGGGSDGVWCWQVGVATCMVMCSLLRREEAAECGEGEVGESRLWSEYFTVQQLLKDRTLSVSGLEWPGREEVKVEVQSVQSLQLDDEHDRLTLKQYEHECPMLREALHKAEKASGTQQSRGVAHEPRKMVRATSAREVGEVKY